MKGSRAKWAECWRRRLEKGTNLLCVREVEGNA